LQKIYYFVNFCLEKINFGAWRGSLLEGGVKLGVYSYIPMVSVSPWSCSTMCSSSSALSERSALSRITRLYLSCITQHNMLSRYMTKFPQTKRWSIDGRAYVQGHDCIGERMFGVGKLMEELLSPPPPAKIMMVIIVCDHTTVFVLYHTTQHVIMESGQNSPR